MNQFIYNINYVEFGQMRIILLREKTQNGSVLLDCFQISTVDYIISWCHQLGHTLQLICGESQFKLSNATLF